MTFDEFIKKYDGKEVDTDGYYGGQCMDLMHQYIVDVLNLPLSLFAAPTAYQAYQNANDPHFDKIANSPTGVPEKGDIVFWNTGIGSAGHVAIFISGDANNFTSFDQNFPTGSFCHKQTHTYKSVAGWLHPKQVVAKMEIEQSLFSELVGKSSEYDKFVAGGFSHLEDVQKVLNEKESTIQNLTKDINSCETQVGKLLDDAQKVNEEDKNTSEELLNAQHALQPLKDEILAINRALGLMDDTDSQTTLKALQLLKDSKVKPAPKPKTFLDKILFLLT